jgi:cell wall-associated NlpC family hydrolase
LRGVDLVHSFFRVFVAFLFVFGMASAAYATAFQEGDEGQDVAQIQQRLNALGYNAGAVDGDFGSMTKSAVAIFQKDRGLEPDGIVGASTYQALMGREIPVSRDGYSTATARRVIETAMRYRGVPYSFGGTTPGGFDCSGFTRYVFSQVNAYLPRAADEQYEVGRAVSYSNLQPGDLVFFSTYEAGPSHVGIYVGGGRFISATSSSGVAITRIDSGYWGSRYIGARRVL